MRGFWTCNTPVKMGLSCFMEALIFDTSKNQKNVVL